MEHVSGSAQVGHPSGLRFALLWHEVGPTFVGETRRSSHFDLFLQTRVGETDERVLLAWAVATNPFSAEGLRIAAQRLADHRQRYLDYQGPISGGRGRVRQVASGSIVWHPQESGQYRVDVVGDCQGPDEDSRFRIQGTLSLQNGESEEWLLVYRGASSG